MSIAADIQAVVSDALVWAFWMGRCTMALMKYTVGCEGLCLWKRKETEQVVHINDKTEAHDQ